MLCQYSVSMQRPTPIFGPRSPYDPTIVASQSQSNTSKCPRRANLPPKKHTKVSTKKVWGCLFNDMGYTLTSSSCRSGLLRRLLATHKLSANTHRQNPPLVTHLCRVGLELNPPKMVASLGFFSLNAPKREGFPLFRAGSQQGMRERPPKKKNDTHPFPLRDSPSVHSHHPYRSEFWLRLLCA